jgi:hypothetical protein
MKHQLSSTIAAKIRKLARLAADLQDGHAFPITRLTTIKSLCADPDAARHFCFYLAQRTWMMMRTQPPPRRIGQEQWAQLTLVAEAITHMECYLHSDTSDIEKLRDCGAALQQVQNTYKHINWGPVRIIESREVLVVEDAVQCFVRPVEAGYWAYHTARDYAERYNPRYGTGLIPESASMVEEIASFWCQYYVGKPLHTWLDGF